MKLLFHLKHEIQSWPSIAPLYLPQFVAVCCGRQYIDIMYAREFVFRNLHAIQMTVVMSRDLLLCK